MAQYVLRHGGISLGQAAGVLAVPLLPSADPAKPTVLELEPAEAARINGPEKQQLLPGVKPKPPCLQLLAEYQAELAGEKAKAEAIAKVKAAAPPVEASKPGKAK